MSLTEPLRAYALTPVAAQCPACGSGEAERLYTVESREAAQHYVVEQREPERHRALRVHIETLWGGPSADVVRCRSCRFAYPQPYVAGDARFWSLAFERHEGAYPTWRWEYDETLAALRGPDGPEAGFRYLEVGPGDGPFLRAVAPALTAKDRCLATDLSPYAVEAVRTYGVRCEEVDVRALDPEAVGRFDVLALFQVLIHLGDLAGLFAHLGRLAAPGAHLFVSTTNPERIELHELHGALMDFPPSVVGRWPREAYAAVAARHGWRLRAYAVEPTPLVPFLKEMAVYRHLRRGQVPGSPANRIEALPGRALRRVFQVPAVAAQALATLPLALRHQGSLPGHANWAWLQRAA